MDGTWIHYSNRDSKDQFEQWVSRERKVIRIAKEYSSSTIWRSVKQLQVYIIIKMGLRHKKSSTCTRKADNRQKFGRSEKSIRWSVRVVTPCLEMVEKS